MARGFAGWFARGFAGRFGCRRMVRCCRGAAAVEMALVAPLLAAVLLGMADFGLVVNERISLSSAARAGAQKAMTDPSNTASIRQAVEVATETMVASRLTVAVSTQCSCSGGSVIVCGATCADGNPRNYVTVQVTEAYPTLFTYPLVGSTLMLSANATLRY